MTISVEQLVRQIHASPSQMVLAVTGGGSQAIAEMLSVPGASRTVLEALVPYSNAALIDFLRATPEHFCAARTARAMAMAAFWRARELTTKTTSQSTDSSPPSNLIGIGCTASLASDRPKRGPHRAHLAIQQLAATTTLSLELEKGKRCRAEEEQIVGRLVLNQIAAAVGVRERLTLPLDSTEKLETTHTAAPLEWQQLLAGERHLCAVTSTPKMALAARRAIFSGAFNPLHAGHRRLAEVANEILGVPVEFEISIENVDKPPLDYTEIAARTAQFNSSLTLWLTRAATFVKKSALFPQAVFVVGADTAIRISDPRYYANDAAACRTAIETIRQNGCRFLVFGRATDTGFQTLEDLPLPTFFRELCQAVPADRFRLDISSTTLRQSASPEK